MFKHGGTETLFHRTLKESCTYHPFIDVKDAEGARDDVNAEKNKGSAGGL